MIRLKARSGHVLTVTDEAGVSFWESRGYKRAQDDASAKPKPVKKAAAKKAAPKQDNK